MDGTWLYYSIVQGRTGRNCPIERKFGPDWKKTHKIDWNKLPQLIAQNLDRQLALRSGGSTHTEITRTSVFTSLRADTEVGSSRDNMLKEFYKNNFDVHR